MKIVKVDNSDREHISDLGGIDASAFYKAVEDDYKLCESEMTEATFADTPRVKERYGIQLDFDVEFEPPKVYIADRQGMGCSYIEVLEEPCLVIGRDWSWKDEDWEIGEIATKLLKFMNSKEFGI